MGGICVAGAVFPMVTGRLLLLHVVVVANARGQVKVWCAVVGRRRRFRLFLFAGTVGGGVEGSGVPRA